MKEVQFDFFKEIDFVHELENDDELFDEEFENLKYFYFFYNKNEVYNYINDMRGIIPILKNLIPILKNKVPYAFFGLEVHHGLDYSVLLVQIKALDVDFWNGHFDHVSEVHMMILPLMKILGYSVEIFLNDDCFDDEIHCIGVLQSLTQYYPAWFDPIKIYDNLISKFVIKE